MTSKKNVLILCGGQSAEHEISLISTINVVNALDKNKFEYEVVAISKKGSWHLLDKSSLFQNQDSPKNITFSKDNNRVFLSPSYYNKQLIQVDKEYDTLPAIDVVLPVLHGPNGEDGSLQGFLQLAGLPVVGCGVLSSALCMDKDITKKILRNEGLGVCNHLLARKGVQPPSYERASAELGRTLFIKPANMGSSVGVSKVTNETEYLAGINEALKFDNKVLIEEAVNARELEVALLGNLDVKASAVGEVAPSDGFYSFDAKYIDSDAAKLLIPADIPKDLSKKVREQAITAFKALECRGLARCDFFYTDKQTLLVNEVNTFPGFTNISQYPMLWKESGIESTELISQLIQLALES